MTGGWFMVYGNVLPTLLFLYSLYHPEIRWNWGQFFGFTTFELPRCSEISGLFVTKYADRCSTHTKAPISQPPALDPQNSGSFPTHPQKNGSINVDRTIKWVCSHDLGHNYPLVIC